MCCKKNIWINQEEEQKVIDLISKETMMMMKLNSMAALVA